MIDPACTEIDIITMLEDDTATWQQVAFPFPSSGRNKSYNRSYDRYLNMKMLKSMLVQMELVPHQDFVFDNNRTLEQHKHIVIRFKDEGNATIAVIKWLGSNWYNGRV